MATVLDIATVITSALTEIGVNGRLDVHKDGSWSTSWVGSPTGADYDVILSVRPMPPADDD